KKWDLKKVLELQDRHILLRKKMYDNDKIAKKSHNKKKNYILQEGMIILFIFAFL
ncbi:Methyltransferase, partial [human gut metagenome]